MHEAGYKIIGVADIHGGLYNEKGFDIPKLVDWVYTQGKPLPDFPGGGAKKTAQEVLFQPCDILVPAATENQITTKNADRLRARILCEGANGPTPPRPMPIIDSKGIFVIPDILANAGGVTVSYFEWVQDRQGFFWRESEVNERLKDMMERVFDRWCATPKNTASTIASPPTWWPSIAWPRLKAARHLRLKRHLLLLSEVILKRVFCAEESA